MEEFVKGQIVVVPFPFSDLSDLKKRPAIVISSLEGNNIILAQITSKYRTEKYSLLVKTQDFQEGKLLIDSFVNCDKIFTLDKEIILRTIGKLDLKNKTVLTIAGSGDQAINALYFGAKEVTCFDINQLTGYFVNLKINALKHLTYKEFLDYFGSPKKIGSLDYKLFTKFYKYLEKDTFNFFNDAYIYFKKDGNKIIRSNLFNERSMLLVTLYEMNIYLKSESNYNRCKELLKKKKITFVCEDILCLNKKLKTKFDIINISNIPNYFCGRFEYDSKEYKQMFDGLLKLVKKKGILFFYLFSVSTYPNEITTRIPPLAINKKLIKFFKQFGLSYKVISFNGNGQYLSNIKVKNVKDKIAILEK